MGDTGRLLQDSRLRPLKPARAAEVATGFLPFSAADLHYRQEGGGCLLYCVGPNGKGRDDWHPTPLLLLPPRNLLLDWPARSVASQVDPCLRDRRQ